MDPASNLDWNYLITTRDMINQLFSLCNQSAPRNRSLYIPNDGVSRDVH